MHTRCLAIAKDLDVADLPQRVFYLPTLVEALLASYTQEARENCRQSSHDAEGWKRQTFARYHRRGLVGGAGHSPRRCQKSSFSFLPTAVDNPIVLSLDLCDYFLKCARRSCSRLVRSLTRRQGLLLCKTSLSLQYPAIGIDHSLHLASEVSMTAL